MLTSAQPADCAALKRGHHSLAGARTQANANQITDPDLWRSLYFKPVAPLHLGVSEFKLVFAELRQPTYEPQR